MDTPSSIKDLINFLDSSPTAWQAVAFLRNKFLQNDYIELLEHQTWNIQPGQRYFVVRNGSSFCAFVTPKNFPKQLRLLASHTDSPGLKLKPQPEILKKGMLLLGVEVYGAPLLTSWLNRDLGIAGRILYTDLQQQIKESVVRLDRYPLTIPQLAIHLDREANEKGVILNKQEHLNALACLEKDFSQHSFLETLLREEIDFDKLIAHDLFLFPLETARLTGYKNAFISSYRIDSLASVHAAYSALLNHSDSLEEEIKMVVFWDNEEVGSQSAQGAQSPFLSQVLQRLIEGLKGTKEDYFCLISRSTCFSIDLAHALHPNYTDKHDAQHQPLLGKGVILKCNAQHRYATSARSLLPVKIFAGLEEMQLQYFVNRGDLPCGSTIGPLHAAATGMATVDIGCGQLSMHASRELMASQDHIALCLLLERVMKTPQAEWPIVVSEIQRS